MKWSKAKTIFIWIFIFVNIFLFTIYKMNSHKGIQIDEQNAGKILAGFGIKADFSSFSSLPGVMAQIEVVNRISEKDFVGGFFENDYNENPDGSLSSDKEKASVDGMTFEYSNSEPSLKGFAGINHINASGKVISYLAGKGMHSNILNAKSVSENKDGSLTVTVGYKYKDYQVLDSEMFVTANKSGVLSVGGKVLDFVEIRNQHYNTIGGVEAFIEYLSGYGSMLKKEKEISYFEYGYYVSEQPGSVSSYAIPAYEVKFTDGSVIYIDGRVDILPEYRVLN